jgi:NAD(P)-dependent dehydrogenase (short-subunit alcohol dehydrogenase family)
VKRVAVVTGGSSGLGLAIVQRLLEGDFSVVGVGQRKEAMIRGWKQLSSRHAHRVSYIQSDLMDHESTERLAEQIASLRPAVLVNAAGVFERSNLGNPVHVRTQLRALCDLHAGAGLQLALQLAPAMARPGHIVFVSSTSATRFVPDMISYAASKAALEVVARSLAVSMPHGICINVIALGLMNTPMSKASVANRSTVEEVERRTPLLGKLVTTKQVAELISGLVSLSSPCLTGNVLVADGGNSLTW